MPLVVFGVVLDAFTVTLSDVELEAEELEAVIGMENVPVAALELALNVRTVPQVGLQAADESDAVTPLGNEPVLKDTVPGLPDTRVALRVELAEDP